jgi:serine/threonine protein kinase
VLRAAIAADLASLKMDAVSLFTGAPGQPSSQSQRARPCGILDRPRLTHAQTDLSQVLFARDMAAAPPRPVILKRLPLARRGLAEAELATLARVAQAQIPHAVALLDSFVDGDCLVLVFPRLARLEASKLAFGALQECMRQLLAALAGLHAAGIAHLDVTPANIMANAASEVTLIDFGLARPTGSTPHPACRGTQGFIAPELYAGMCNDAKPDIYSAGIVFGMWLQPFVHDCGLEFLGSKLVRAGVTAEIQRQLQDLVCERCAESGRPDAVYEAADLLARMLESDPCERVSAADALRHRFFRLDAAALACVVAGSCSPRKRPRRDADIEIIRYR